MFVRICLPPAPDEHLYGLHPGDRRSLSREFPRNSLEGVPSIRSEGQSRVWLFWKTLQDRDFSGGDSLGWQGLGVNCWADLSLQTLWVLSPFSDFEGLLT